MVKSQRLDAPEARASGEFAPVEFASGAAVRPPQRAPVGYAMPGHIQTAMAA
jgi:hypothetical protein